MDLDRVYEPHNLQDVLTAWTNGHLLQCHLRHLTNWLSRGARQGLTGKRQMETWIVTAAARQLFGRAVSQGAFPRAALTLLLFTSQPRGYLSRVSWSRRKHCSTGSSWQCGRRWLVMGVLLLSRPVRYCQTITKVYRIKKNGSWPAHIFGGKYSVCMHEGAKIGTRNWVTATTLCQSN